MPAFSATPSQRTGVQRGPKRISKKRTNFCRSAEPMALSQRLLIRQSQALVMTPQLMQAIKLLQLSNLDLAAYVEAELERNPLLERAGEGEEPGAARGAPGTTSGRGADAPAARPRLARPRSSRPAAPRSRSVSTPSSKTSFRTTRRGPRSARRAAEPPAYSEWSGVGAGGRDDGDYNLEAFVSAETTLADHLAEQLVAGDRRSGAPHDRPVPDRSGRRGRLSRGRSRRRWPRSSALRSPRSRAVLAIAADLRSVRASARAISPNASPSSSRSATASIRPCRRWSTISICWPGAISPALQKHLRRRRRGSRRHDRRDPRRSIRSPASPSARP